MPRFEVHIPGAKPDDLTVTLRVDAPNWMQALKTGFLKLGEAGLVVHNVLVDVADDGSLHVTESTSGRVFRIKELTAEEDARAKVKPAPSPTPAGGSRPRWQHRRRQSGRPGGASGRRAELHLRGTGPAGGQRPGPSGGAQRAAPDPAVDAGGGAAHHPGIDGTHPAGAWRHWPVAPTAAPAGDGGHPGGGV